MEEICLGPCSLLAYMCSVWSPHVYKMDLEANPIFIFKVLKDSARTKTSSQKSTLRGIFCKMQNLNKKNDCSACNIVSMVWSNMCERREKGLNGH